MKFTLISLILGLALAAPLALADEAHPDCEEYQTTYAYPENRDESGDRQPVEDKPRICEGEHWDGEDTTASPDTETHALADADGVYVSLFTGKDPVTPDAEENGATDAFHTRLSIQMTDGVHVYYYGALYGLGEMATDASSTGKYGAIWLKDGTNQGPLGPIWEAFIRGINNDADEGGADGNLLAWIVGDLGLLPQGMKTGEDDCTQVEYQTSDCERDNTAMTIELP